MFRIIQNVLAVASLVLALVACWKVARRKAFVGYLILAVILFAISIIN